MMRNWEITHVVKKVISFGRAATSVPPIFLANRRPCKLVNFATEAYTVWDSHTSRHCDITQLNEHWSGQIILQTTVIIINIHDRSLWCFCTQDNSKTADVSATVLASCKTVLSPRLKWTTVRVQDMHTNRQVVPNRRTTGNKAVRDRLQSQLI
jgi:hypothetical protein